MVLQYTRVAEVVYTTTSFLIRGDRGQAPIRRTIGLRLADGSEAWRRDVWSRR